MIKKRIIITGISGLVAIGFLSVSPASADSITGPSTNHSGRGGVIGIVSSVSGSSITLISKDRQATSTFAVDATNATVTKAGATSSLSAIQTGDTLLVRGSVTGTNVVATKIIDGLPVMKHNGKAGKSGRNASSSAAMKNRPAFGSVTAVNGGSFTLQTKAFKGRKAASTPALALTVNTSSTTVFKKDGQTATLADLASGQNIMVIGTRDSTGTMITASRVNIVTGTSTARWNKRGGTGKKNT